MTLQQLKYFIKVAECKTILEAAEQLFISQPSLSNAIKELENEFNFTLFTRSNTGIALTEQGFEFLSYARQVVEQADLIDEKFSNKKQPKKICSISTQHYSFAVEAFVKTIEKSNLDKYDFTIRETRTFEIIEDVKTFRSELGILYLSNHNRKVIASILKESNLKFFTLKEFLPHVFISCKNPLSKNNSIKLEDLEPYPCLSFEQGNHNSFYFSEEILSTIPHSKNIRVSDRATLFNLLIGLNGYTICTGIINNNLNDDNIISKPLETDERIEVGYIVNEKTRLSLFANEYIDEIKNCLI